MSRKGDAVQLLAIDMKAVGLPDWFEEYKFHPKRRWRFDFAWIAQAVAAEVDGGTFVAGRHTSGVGYRKDCEKLNAAVVAGWKVLRFTTEMVRDGTAIETLEEMLR